MINLNVSAISEKDNKAQMTGKGAFLLLSVQSDVMG